MTGDLVPRQDVDSWVPMLGAVGDLAAKIANTEFVAKSLRGRAPAVAASILAGRERGLGPMVSLAGIDVVDGRPTLNAQLLAALVYRAGHKITVIENTDKAAEVKIERGDGLGEATVRWTMADAQKAGLAGKRNWQQYARQMLYARALSECARIAAPDVALGLDVDATVADTAPTTRPATVVQLQRTEDEPAVDQQYGETVPEVRQQSTSSPLPIEDAQIVDGNAVTPDPEPLITGAQMRKLGALIGLWEKSHDQKLDRDQRRSMIADLAQVEQLASAKDLTRTEASRAIEALEMGTIRDPEPSQE